MPNEGEETVDGTAVVSGAAESGSGSGPSGAQQAFSFMGNETDEPSVAPVQEPLKAVPAPAPTPVPAAPAAESARAVEPLKAAPEMPKASPPESIFASIQQELERNAPQFEKAVAERVYALRPEEIEALQSEPEKIVPQLMARAHVNIVRNVVSTLAAQLPQVVHGLIAASKQHQTLQDKFYEAWPQLDPKKHGPDVAKMAAAYRQLNPNATFEEMVRTVGAQSVVALGLLAQTPTKVAAVKAPAFQPAASSAAAGGALVPPENGFAEFARYVLADQEGKFDE